MRGVLGHRAHDRLIAGAGKAGVVDEVPDLVCDGQGRPKAVLSDADRNRGYCGRGRACNRIPRPTPPVYPVGCRAHTLRRQQLSRAARHRRGAPRSAGQARPPPAHAAAQAPPGFRAASLSTNVRSSYCSRAVPGSYSKPGSIAAYPDMCLASALDEVTSALQLRRFGCNRFPVRGGWVSL